jgi:hypothetical protein
MEEKIFKIQYSLICTTNKINNLVAIYSELVECNVSTDLEIFEKSRYEYLRSNRNFIVCMINFTAFSIQKFILYIIKRIIMLWLYYFSASYIRDQVRETVERLKLILSGLLLSMLLVVYIIGIGLCHPQFGVRNEPKYPLLKTTFSSEIRSKTTLF